MRDPDDDAAQQPTETLRVGPSRPPLFRRVPTRWRRPVVVVLAFVLGVAAGGGGVPWWQAQPAPPSFRPDEHAVELLPFEAVAPRTPPGSATARDQPVSLEITVLDCQAEDRRRVAVGG